MHQMPLQFWAPDSVRGIVDAYLAMRAPSLTAETLEDAYQWIRRWLFEVFGETTSVRRVTFDVIDTAARSGVQVLKHVTVKKRLIFWRSALRYAAMRGIVPKDSLPELPPWLIDDSLRGDRFYTLPQYQEFRLAVPPGRFRKLVDLSMLTGMHTVDLYSTARWMLEPDYEWPGSDVRGRWLRRNNKNANPKKPIKIKPCWVVMEPELRERALEWLSERGQASDLITGPVNNVAKTFEAAAVRANLHRIRPNLDFRASHSTLLMKRGWSYEYVRIVLGHVGEVSGDTVDGHIRARTAKRPTTLSAHYLRPDAGPEHRRP